MGEGWIGVDLDGTLAKYDRWMGEDHIGEPIAPMVSRVKRWISSGKVVKIVTARASSNDAEELKFTVDAIKAWTKKHIGTELEVTCRKDYGMIVLFDDRAVSVEKNTGKILVPEFENF